jgi:tetratricopeptide (TPR) repeat protein
MSSSLSRGSRSAIASAVVGLALAMCGGAAAAHERSIVERPINSELDAPLLYQLLIGELELRNGETGTAYQVLLDAARRTGDEGLYKRVVQIAVQARAGDQALSALRAWTTAHPDSSDAWQSTVQLLAVLNRPADAVEPMRNLLSVGTSAERLAALAMLPQWFQRSPEPQRVAAAMAPVLQAQQGELKAAALVTEARLSLSAGLFERAEAIARQLAELYPEADDAMILALDLLPHAPGAEALITQRLAAQPGRNALRQAYARALVRMQRAADAAREFRELTQRDPDEPAHWLALGALDTELRHVVEAEAALREVLKRLDTPPKDEAKPEAAEEAKRSRSELRRQALLLLSQLAEQRDDLKGAERWLSQVEGAQIDVRYRRASLLARQHKLAEARALLQAPVSASDDEARTHLLAEAQLLREQRDWRGALGVLKQIDARIPDDPDILYEQAMLEERLGEFDQMEERLRRVIAVKADHHHAYNALGYSLAERNLRLPEAKALIEQALKLSPGEPFIVDSLGWVEYRLGNLAEATRLLTQAHAARPDAEIAAHLGEVLWVSGKQDDARRVWREALGRDARNEALRETLDRLKVGL